MTHPAPTPTAPRGRLALAMQEVLTVTARLRSGKQVAADGESFRTQLRALVSAAQQEARQAGYPDDDVNLALFAVVAFADESVLNSQQPMFAGWSRRPLQEELFQTNRAGELFFDYAQHAMQRPPGGAPAQLADLLEVFALCMVLGFKGRHAHVPADAQAVAGQMLARVRQLRGEPGPLAPAWSPAAVVVAPNVRDPWVRRLAAIATVAVLLTVGLYVGYRSSLARGAEALRAVPAPSAVTR